MSLRIGGDGLASIVASVTSRPDMGLMGPAIGKEVVHYAVFDYLDELGYLDDLVFQGGTCLRDCYGSPRLSEDLDFNVPPEFDFASLAEMGNGLARSLGDAFELRVRVKEPSVRRMGPASGIPIAKWVVSIETDPQDSSLPLQRIKLGVAKAPAHDVLDRFLLVNYEQLPESLGDIVIRAESPEEIFADKVVSFAASSYLRYRDIWDLKWLATRPGLDRGLAESLVGLKVEDYGIGETWRACVATARGKLSDALEAEGFVDEMSRFLPRREVARTAGRRAWVRATVGVIGGIYDSLASHSQQHTRRGGARIR